MSSQAKPLPVGISIGVDIGVSTSGISYCLVGPSGEHGPPTSVLLLQERAELQPSVLGKTQQPGNWGSGVKSEEDKLTLIKLALPGDELRGGAQHPEHLRAVQTELSKISAAGYDGVGVLAEYMSRMWAAAIIQLERQIEAGLNGPIPPGMTVGFVFGIPAVWGEQVIERMEKAIAKSGITDQAAFTDLIIEPEAAALAILPLLVEEGVVKKDDNVVIADLGGGTVDFISYTLPSVTPLDVRECVSGEGQLLGDMFINLGEYVGYLRAVK